MKRDVKKKNCFIALSFVLIFSIFLNSVYAISLGQEKQIKTMEQIVSENLVKTQKVVVKDADTEEVKYERNLTSSPKLRTMSAVSEDVTLVSGESATYYDEYNNIQDLKNAIIENYPEKDDEEVAKDILRALDQDEDVIDSITTNEVDVILDYESAMGASNYYSVLETTEEVTKECITRNSNNLLETCSSLSSQSNGPVGTSGTVKTYTWVGYYGKDVYGDSQFKSYATIRWNEEDDSNRFTDIIAVAAFNDSSPIEGIENNILEKGSSGYLSRDYKCKNYKIENTPAGEDDFGEYYTTWTGSLQDNILLENGNITYRDNNMQNIKKFITITAFESPYTIPYECNEYSTNELYYIRHAPEYSNTKYYVSSYYVNNQRTNFSGLYIHTKKQYKTSTSVGIGAGIDFGISDTSIAVSASISKNFEKDYIKIKIPTPTIVARFNGNNFVDFTY